MNKILKNIVVTSFSHGGKTYFVNKLQQHPLASYPHYTIVDKPSVFEAQYDEIQTLIEQYGDSIYLIVLVPNVTTRLEWLAKKGVEERKQYEIIGRSETDERKILDQHANVYNCVVRGYGEETDIDALIEKIHEEIFRL